MGFGFGLWIGGNDSAAAITAIAVLFDDRTPMQWDDGSYMLGW